MNFSSLWKKKDSFNAIALLESDRSLLFRNYGNTFMGIDNGAIGDNTFCASFITPKDVIASSLRVDVSIPLEEHDDFIRLRAYEELSLEEDNEYAICCQANRVEDNGDVVSDIFAISKESLDKRFSPMRVKYIDYIAFAPLLYQSLFHKKLTREGVDLFIYIGESDAFLTIYQQGNYLYSKSFKHSLSFIYDRFCDHTGEKFLKEDFNVLFLEEAFTQEGVNYNFFTTLFNELFLGLNDILIYTRRVYGIGDFSNLFMTTTYGNIEGLSQFTQEHFGMNVQGFNFGLSQDVSPLLSLLLEYVKEMAYTKEIPSQTNFSLYPRPPHFFERASVKFLMASMGGVMFALFMPSIYWMYGGVIAYQNHSLEVKQKTIEHKAQEFKHQRENLIQEIRELEKKQVLYDEKLLSRIALLEETYRIMVTTKSRATLLSQMGQMLGASKVKAYEFTFDDTNATFKASANSEKAITRMLGMMVHQGMFKSVFTRSIVYDTNTSSYLCDVEVKF